MLRMILEMIAQRSNELDTGFMEFVDKIYAKEISNNYHKSFIALKRVTKDFAEFPTIEGWNKYAKENNYLSHVSIQYLLRLKWKKIRKLVEYQIQEEK